MSAKNRFTFLDFRSHSELTINAAITTLGGNSLEKKPIAHQSDAVKVDVSNLASRNVNLKFEMHELRRNVSVGD